MVKGWMRLTCMGVQGRSYDEYQLARCARCRWGGVCAAAGLSAHTSCRPAGPAANSQNLQACPAPVASPLRMACSPESSTARACHSHSAAMAYASARLGTTNAFRAGVRSTRWSSRIWKPPCGAAHQWCRCELSSRQEAISARPAVHQSRHLTADAAALQSTHLVVSLLHLHRFIEARHAISRAALAHAMRGIS